MGHDPIKYQHYFYNALYVVVVVYILDMNFVK